MDQLEKLILSGATSDQIEQHIIAVSREAASQAKRARQNAWLFKALIPLLVALVSFAVLILFQL